jgi:hypothetical protein
MNPGPTITVTAVDKSSLYHELTLAERMMRVRAENDRKMGIVVTRHGLDVFTVALSEKVPYGETHERNLWSSAAIPDCRGRQEAGSAR